MYDVVQFFRVSIHVGNKMGRLLAFFFFFHRQNFDYHPLSMLRGSFTVHLILSILRPFAYYTLRYNRNAIDSPTTSSKAICRAPHHVVVQADPIFLPHRPLSRMSSPYTSNHSRRLEISSSLSAERKINALAGCTRRFPLVLGHHHRVSAL